jgi:acyl transferase domain-containing protein/acyl carrier protein
VDACGLRPVVLFGRAVGEFVAACVAGVFDVPTALALVADPARAVDVAPRPPAITIVSSTTGAVLSAEEATDPAYWAGLLDRPTSLAAAARTLGGHAGVLVDTGRDTLGGPQALPGATTADTLPPTVRITSADREGWLTALGRLWELGVPVEWAAAHHAPRTLLRLPGYRFQRARYWPEIAPTGPFAGDGAAVGRPSGARGMRFLAPAWRRQDGPPAVGSTEPGTTLVLAHPGGLGAALVKQAAVAGDDVLLALPADSGPAQPDEVVFDPARPDHYVRLLTDAHLSDTAPDRPLRVVHALDQRGLGDLVAGCCSLLWLVQAIGRVLPDRHVDLVVALPGAFDVLGGEDRDPMSAAVVGLCGSIAVEYPRIRCRAVDPEATADPATAASWLWSELTLPAPPSAAAGGDAADDHDLPQGVLTAWRRGRRWLPVLERLHLPSVSDDQVWRPGAAYAITGGTSGLGLAIARKLAPMGARLALIGRTALPDPAEWSSWSAGHDPDDRVSQILRAVGELRDSGAEVLLISADISDPVQTSAAFATIRSRFGELYGVLHAAGVPGEGLLQSKTREQVAAVLAPKVAGTLAIADALRDSPPELLVLYSSAVTAAGGHGEGDYAVANAFLDAFAAAEDGAGRVANRVVSVGWGAWRHDRWQAQAYAGAPALRERARRLRDEFGITDVEGADALGRAIAAGPAHLYALNQSLPEMLAAARTLTDPLAMAGQDSGVPVESRFPRPDLRVAYAPPRTDTERRVAEVWQALLGIREVGVQDPFFELGGTSLVSLAVIARLSAEFATELPAAALFENPTVRQLAALLDRATDPGAAQRQQVDDRGGIKRGEQRRALAARAGASTIKRRRTGK